MEKKSKLSIKHIYGEEELKKLKVPPTGFPLYVQVRYKGVKKLFASRVGIKFASSHAVNKEELRHHPEVAQKIIEEETKHIEDVREYFEEVLGLEFKLSTLTNPYFEYSCWQKVEDFFNSLPNTYLIEKVLLERSGSWASVRLLKAAGPIFLMDALQDLNIEIWEKLMGLSNNRELFDYYQLFKSIGDQDVNRLQFRIMNIENGEKERNFKSWIDKKFDEEIKKMEFK
ncbi:MAG: hypothetical protein WD426_03460 [Anditalea sp.]